MTGKSILEGFKLIRSRFRLVVLIYALNLALAFIIVFPIYPIFLDSVGMTGAGRTLMQEFDLLLWREVIIAYGPELLDVLQRVVWLVPAFWIWKTATQMGLIYALHQGALWPFWSGVYFHTWRGVLIGFFFLPLKLAWLVFVIVGISLLQPTFSSQVELFWLMGVVMPSVLLTGLAIIDLYQRYARMGVVIRNDRVWSSIWASFRWPGKSSAITWVYLAWYAFALLFAALGVFANAKLHVGVEWLLMVFALQQLILLGRAAVSVGWVGSEVFLFEGASVKKREKTSTVKKRA